MNKWLERKKTGLCIMTTFCLLSLFVIYTSSENVIHNSEKYYAVKIHHYGIDITEIERSITIPLEDALYSIPGVSSVQSSSENNLSTVYVRFQSGEKGHYDAVRDMAQRIYETLPSSAQRPEILNSSNSLIPVWSAAVYTNSSDVSAQMLEKTIKSKLEGLEGTAEVMVSGISQKDIYIDIDQEKMMTLGLNLSEIATYLAGNDSIFSGGKLTINNREIILNIDGRYESTFSTGNLTAISLDKALIPLGEGKVIQLSDIAVINIHERLPDTLSRLNGKKAAVISVMGKHGADLSKLSSDIKKESSRLPYEFIILSDLGAEEAAAYRSVLNAAVSGAIMVAVICLLFNRKKNSLLSGFFCAMTIPAVCLISAAVLSIFSFKLNRLLLAGIASGIGIAVDSVILCSEKLRKSNGFYEAKEALSELTSPLIAGAATTAVALLPLLIANNGEVKIIASAISVMTLVALVISLLFLPPLTLWKINLPSGKFIMKPSFRRIYHHFVRTSWKLLAMNLRFCINNPMIVITIFIVLTAAAITAFILKGVDTAGYSSQDSVYAQVEFDTALLVEETDRILAYYSEKLSFYREISNVQTIARTGSGSLLISFNPKFTNAQHVKELAKKIPLQQGFIFFHEHSPDIRYWEIRISGDEDRKCRELAHKFAGICSGNPDIRECVLNFKDGPNKLTLIPNRESMANINIDFSMMANILRHGVYGPVVYKKIESNNETDVRIRTGRTAYYSGEQTRLTMEEILHLFLNEALYVNSLMQLRNDTEVSSIRRIDRRRTASITLITAPGDPRRIKQKLLPLFEKLELPPGYSIEFDPDQIKEANDLSSTVVSLIMAVIFCYMIIAAVSESFINPLIVLSAIPPSLSIPALCLFITGASYNSAIACAFIAATGMTVNAAVICVDALNANTKDSFLIIYHSIRSKITALVATTTTTIAGAIPFVFLREGANTLIRALSIVCALGIACSFFVSITLIPSLLFLYRKSSKLLANSSFV
ncbi:MAG: efflux RND transporter permease subunit [Treponema sp.]|nr:efflux RND transporter permease subunit [Treponema sp.]